RKAKQPRNSAYHSLNHSKAITKGQSMQTQNSQARRNVAVVGVGYWGKNLVRNFHALEALGALCDSDKSLAENYEKMHPEIRFYSQYREVLANPTISGVALATPAVAHYEMAKAALEAGKDVLVEKPLAID